MRYLAKCTETYRRTLSHILRIGEDEETVRWITPDIGHINTHVELPFISFLDDSTRILTEGEVENPLKVILNNYLEVLPSFYHDYLQDRGTLLARLESFNLLISPYDPEWLLKIDIPILISLIKYQESSQSYYEELVHLDYLLRNNEEKGGDSLPEIIFQQPADGYEVLDRLNNLQEDTANKLIWEIKDLWIEHCKIYQTSTHSDVILHYLYAYSQQFKKVMDSYLENKYDYLNKLLGKLEEGDDPTGDNFTYNQISGIQSDVLPDDYITEINELYSSTSSTINNAAQNLPSNPNSTVVFPTFVGNLENKPLVPSVEGVELNPPRLPINQAVIMVNKDLTDNHNTGVILDNLYDMILDAENNKDGMYITLPDLDYSQILDLPLDNTLDLKLPTIMEDVQNYLDQISSELDKVSLNPSKQLQADTVVTKNNIGSLQYPDSQYVDRLKEFSGKYYEQGLSNLDTVDHNKSALDSLNLGGLQETLKKYSDYLKAYNVDIDEIPTISNLINKLDHALENIAGIQNKVCNAVNTLNEAGSFLTSVKNEVGEISSVISGVSDKIDGLVSSVDALADLVPNSIDEGVKFLEDTLARLETLNSHDLWGDLKEKVTDLLGQDAGGIFGDAVEEIFSVCSNVGDSVGDFALSDISGQLGSMIDQAWESSGLGGLSSKLENLGTSSLPTLGSFSADFSLNMDKLPKLGC